MHGEMVDDEKSLDNTIFASIVLTSLALWHRLTPPYDAAYYATEYYHLPVLIEFPTTIVYLDAPNDSE